MNGLNRESFKYSPVTLLEGELPAKACSRVEVKAGHHQELVTVFDGTAPFTSARLEIELGANSSLHHWLILQDAVDSIRLEEMSVVVGKDAHYTLNALTLGSKWSRSDVVIRLSEPGAECHLLGLDLAKGKAHADRHLRIEHEAPHTTSTQLFKGIFDDEASASFFGMIKVHHGADGSSAKQTNRNLLLSSGATANTRPQLEIDTDDVSCTHGATVGQLDDDAVFFLRSRGLSERSARALLTEAFAREVLNSFKPSTQKEDIERRVLAWLKKE